jgi:hypothetical protein
MEKMATALRLEAAALCQEIQASCIHEEIGLLDHWVVARQEEEAVACQEMEVEGHIQVLCCCRQGNCPHRTM